jgi:hypothetical protein
MDQIKFFSSSCFGRQTAAGMLTGSLFAQQASLRLISPAGGFIQSAQGLVSFSIGEPVIGTITGSGYVITQGFQQSEQTQCTITGFDAFTSTSVYSKLDSFKLNGGASYTGYGRSTGDTSQSIHVKYTGGDKVTVTNPAGCTGTDSIFVQFPDTVGLHVSSVNGQCNKQVDVPMRATAFSSMQVWCVSRMCRQPAESILPASSRSRVRC